MTLLGPQKYCQWSLTRKNLEITILRYGTYVIIQPGPHSVSRLTPAFITTKTTQPYVHTPHGWAKSRITTATATTTTANPALPTCNQPSLTGTVLERALLYAVYIILFASFSFQDKYLFSLYYYDRSIRTLRIEKK